MGGVVKTVGMGAIPGMASVEGTKKMAGSSPGQSLLKSMGLAGEQGEYFNPETENGALRMLNGRNNVANGDAASRAVENYALNGDSLSNALATGHDQGYDGNQMSAFTNRLASDPLTGSKLATEQVQGNGILGGLFGKGGTLNQAGDEYSKLRNQGFKLTQDDHEAYGQASGDIARMFGQSEASLGQSLADRGLAGGNNGAAGVGFSGLQGNKNEMLAKAQTDIANKRMQNTQERMASTQSFLSQLGKQGNTAINDQYSRNQQGIAAGNGDIKDAAKLTIAQNGGENDANLASLQDQRGAKGKTLLEGLGNGLFSSATGIGAAPGKAAGAYAGSAGGAKMGA